MRMGISLGINRLGGGGFSPLSLFSAGEQGVFYDPSDLSTLFQDSAGTTPVTTAGQSVGLVLDKSKKLALGAELVTNGDFSGGATDWTQQTATFSVSSGVASLVGANATVDSALFSTVAGSWYRLVIQVTATDGQLYYKARRGDTNANLLDLGSGAETTGTKTFYFQAASATTYLRFNRGGAAGTTSFDNVSVRLLPGNHATQSTAASRPTYQTSGGLHWLAFDGSDDFLVTGTITPGVDKAQVFAGVRKLSDATTGTILENSFSPGTLSLAHSDSGTAGYFFASRGSTERSINRITFTAPISSVLTAEGDISGDLARLRVNGVAGQNTGDQGTGNYSALPLYIGRRGGTTLPFNGNIYGLIVRFSSANLDAARISSTERWIAAKTGVTI